jgi:hypothetical protein
MIKYFERRHLGWSPPSIEIFVKILSLEGPLGFDAAQNCVVPETFRNASGSYSSRAPSIPKRFLRPKHRAVWQKSFFLPVELTKSSPAPAISESVKREGRHPGLRPNFQMERNPKQPRPRFRHQDRPGSCAGKDRRASGKPGARRHRCLRGPSSRTDRRTPSIHRLSPERSNDACCR